jgi:hypothetical protein
VVPLAKSEPLISDEHPELAVRDRPEELDLAVPILIGMLDDVGERLRRGQANPMKLILAHAGPGGEVR